MDHEVLADRLNRLERSNRRLRLWLAFLTIALLVGTFFRPFLLTRNPRGGEHIGMTTFSGDAVQGFWDAQNKRRLELGVLRKGSSVFYLLDQDERVRLGLDLQPQPSLTFRDQDGAARIGLSLSTDGSPRFVLVGPSGKGRIFFGFGADGNPVFQMTDKDDAEIFRVPDIESP